MVTACGQLDYSYKQNQFADSARKERSLGTIHFHYGNDQSYDVSMNRIRGGYALNAPLYEQDALRVNFTTSHDSRSGDFVGLRSRWEF